MVAGAPGTSSSARSYHYCVTVHDVLLQYESRLHELQTGIAQLSLPYVQAAGVLTLAVGLFLAITVYAISGTGVVLLVVISDSSRSGFPPAPAVSSNRIPDVAPETLLRPCYAASARRLASESAEMSSAIHPTCGATREVSGISVTSVRL